MVRKNTLSKKYKNTCRNGSSDDHSYIPSQESIVSEKIFTSPKGRTYRIITTNQTNYSDEGENEEKNEDINEDNQSNN